MSTPEPDDSTQPHTPESALLVPVAAATAAVGPWRERFDPSTAGGVPPHITVLYPFIPPEQVTERHVRDLATLFARVRAFDFTLDHVGWFGDTVVYVAPTPAEPFVALTRLVMERFPDYPPYGGAHPDITPHLTIGDRGSVVDLRLGAAAVARALPIRASRGEVWFMHSTTRHAPWRVRARFALLGDELSSPTAVRSAP